MSDNLFTEPLNLPSMEDRMKTLLRLIGIEFRNCYGCEEPLAFVIHRGGAKTPYTFDGLNHFITCSKADRFRRPK